MAAVVELMEKLNLRSRVFGILVSRRRILALSEYILIHPCAPLRAVVVVRKQL